MLFLENEETMLLVVVSGARGQRPLTECGFARGGCTQSITPSARGSGLRGTCTAQRAWTVRRRVPPAPSTLPPVTATWSPPSKPPARLPG
eukprot:832968-Rhodomonas_salina.1